MIWIWATIHYINKMYDKTKQKALGKFKSEETFEITDFCGLKPKC